MNRKRNIFVKMAGVLLVGLLCFQFISCSPKERTVIRFWHTYTGERASAFQKLVYEYNRTEGNARGVEVVAYYKATLEQLSKALNSGEEIDLPNMIEVTDESAYLAYLNSRIVSAEQYLTKEELSEYVPGFLNKGRFTVDGDTYIFPLQASLDVMYLNESMLAEFKAACPDFDETQLQTWKGVYEVAQRYYAWSGKSFLAIDNLSDYIMTVADQNTAPIVQKWNKGVRIVLNQEVLREIWDFYYSGTLRGYISSSESSVNYQMETGQVACYLAATSDAKWVPLTYRNQADVNRPVSLSVRQYPSASSIKVGIPSSIRGVAVVDVDPFVNQEAYHFLHWIARNEHVYKMTAANTDLPVHKDVLNNENVYKALCDYVSDSNPSVSITYAEAYRQVTTQNLYSVPVFYGSEYFTEEISRSLLDATRESKALMESLMADGASYEEALAELEQDAYFSAWMEKLESIRSKY